MILLRKLLKINTKSKQVFKYNNKDGYLTVDYRRAKNACNIIPRTEIITVAQLLVELNNEY